jgi:hypothetical protein
MEEDLDEIDEQDDGLPTESAKKRLTFEKRLQERSKKRAVQLKKEAKKARGRKLAAIKTSYKKNAQRFNESLARTNKITKQLNEAARGASSNSGTKAAAGTAQLRKKLAESKLSNVKLAYATKVLQTESLSKRQKSQVVKKLDECRTAREAKLVYESVAKSLSKSRKAMNESAPRGSSSAPTRTGSAGTLNEGADLGRWQKMAGIK